MLRHAPGAKDINAAQKTYDHRPQYRKSGCIKIRTQQWRVVIRDFTTEKTGEANSIFALKPQRQQHQGAIIDIAQFNNANFPALPCAQFSLPGRQPVIGLETVCDTDRLRRAPTHFSLLERSMDAHRRPRSKAAGDVRRQFAQQMSGDFMRHNGQSRDSRYAARQRQSRQYALRSFNTTSTVRRMILKSSASDQLRM